MHIKNGPSKDTSGILPCLDSEYPDRAPSLIAVYNLTDITEDEQNDNPTREGIAGKQITRYPFSDTYSSSLITGILLMSI